MDIEELKKEVKELSRKLFLAQIALDEAVELARVIQEKILDSGGG